MGAFWALPGSVLVRATCPRSTTPDSLTSAQLVYSNPTSMSIDASREQISQHRPLSLCAWASRITDQHRGSERAELIGRQQMQRTADARAASLGIKGRLAYVWHNSSFASTSMERRRHQKFGESDTSAGSHKFVC
jgi:hypothetical protein